MNIVELRVCRSGAGQTHALAQLSSVPDDSPLAHPFASSKNKADIGLKEVGADGKLSALLDTIAT